MCGCFERIFIRLGCDEELVESVLEDPTNSLIEENEVAESEVERDVDQNNEEEEPLSIKPLSIESAQIVLNSANCCSHTCLFCCATGQPSFEFGGDSLLTEACTRSHSLLGN